MAKMYPPELRDYNPTGSELDFFNALKSQLPDRISVFYSVKWYAETDGVRENSECDFLVFDPDFGFLTIEVKGGTNIILENNQWILIEGHEGSDSQYRVLKKSPFTQAEQSMRFFKTYFEEQYQQRFPGIFGFACAFPNYNVTQDFGPEAPRELVIDYKDMSNLKERINRLFHYWKGHNSKFVFFPPDARNLFIKMVKKRIALSAATGALLKEHQKRFTMVNRIQDNYLEFISNYRQVFIAGGAGTGKTWMAIKKAMQLANEGKSVLLLCYNHHLMDFLREQTKDFEEIKCYNFWHLISEILGHSEFSRFTHDGNLPGIFDALYERTLPKFDAVIVDEAQDFTEEWALTVRLFLRDESNSYLYVFYDKEQNIFGRDFRNAFAIETPPFILRENIRNTPAIYKWAVAKTGLGTTSRPSILLIGAEPEQFSFTRARSARSQLAAIINNLLVKELVPNTSITILSNRKLENSFLRGEISVGTAVLVEGEKAKLEPNEIFYRTVQGFKGLESDIIIYLQHVNANRIEANKQQSYVAYTRARFYLYVIEYEED